MKNLVDFWGRTVLALARAYGELKLDAVILAEGAPASLSPSHYTMIQPALKTMRNLVNFYDALLIIQTGKVPLEGLQAFFQLEANVFSPANSLSEIISASPPKGILLGGAIPCPTLLSTVEYIEKAMFKLLNGGGMCHLFVTTDGEVTLTTPHSNLHNVVQLLNEATIN